MFTALAAADEGSLLIKYDLQFFAEDANGAEKTEEPTAKKLDDARKEGQVAKSKELNGAVSLFAMFLVLKIFIGNLGLSFIEVFSEAYRRIPEMTVFFDGRIIAKDYAGVMNIIITKVLMMLLPFLAVAFGVAFIVDLVQVKWKPTGKPLQPKLSKINPIKGLKRIFSMNSVAELVKSLLKIGLAIPIVYFYIRDKVGLIYSFYDMPLMQAIILAGTTIIDLGIRISAIYIIIAAADFGYQKWKFHKDMMMSKQEVKDEYKNSEGDPQVKGKIKRKMMEASRRRMMQKLPEADVVITNPTHYAVAIKYEPAERDAPYVIAKGEAYLAQKIKEVAKEHGIEIVENKPVARALYHNVEIGESVPPELYQAVAEILAFVYHLQGRI